MGPWVLNLCRQTYNELTQQCSNLLAEEYDALSDATMESLLDSLENLLDDIGIPEYEVDYHV